MTRRLNPITTAVVVVVLLCAMAAPAAAQDRAEAVVGSFQSAMLQAMKQAGLGLSDRYHKLLPAVESTFQTQLMTRIVTGQYWKTSSAAQRKRLVAAFTRMSAGTLATFLGGYDGERFEVVRTRLVSGATVMVDTRVVRPDRDPIAISYVVGQFSGRWWIIDVVVAGGISELTVRRSEYARILDSGGVDRLIAALEAKADRMLAGPGGAGQR